MLLFLHNPDIIHIHVIDGYVFDDTFTATINGGSELIRKVFHLEDSVSVVTFQVEAISAQTSAPIQLTLKMRSLFWRLDNGQRSMTVTLEPGDSLVLPGAQKRNGTTCDVLWSCDEMQARSGDSLSYEVLMQYLSSLPSAADDLVLRGKIIRG